MSQNSVFFFLPFFRSFSFLCRTTIFSIEMVALARQMDPKLQRYVAKSYFFRSQKGDNLSYTIQVVLLHIFLTLSFSCKHISF